METNRNSYIKFQDLESDGACFYCISICFNFISLLKVSTAGI